MNGVNYAGIEICRHCPLPDCEGIKSANCPLRAHLRQLRQSPPARQFPPAPPKRSKYGRRYGPRISLTSASTLGKKIKLIRRALNLTQVALARAITLPQRLNILPATAARERIGQWEAGYYYTLDDESVTRIAQLVQLPSYALSEDAWQLRITNNNKLEVVTNDEQQPAPAGA